MPEPYEVLDVPADADERTIRAAYEDLLKEHHPDHGGSRERFLRIKRAYEQLTEEDELNLRPPKTVGCPEVRVAKPVRHEGEPALMARGDGLEIRLLALTDRIETERLLPEHVEHGHRLAACFSVRCRADDPVTWKGRRVRFVDGDGERHLPSVYRPDAADLPGDWRSDDVEVAPAETVQSFLLSRSVPADAELHRVVYDGSPSIGEERGLRFDLDEDRRFVLDRDPFR